MTNKNQEFKHVINSMNREALKIIQLLKPEIVNDASKEIGRLNYPYFCKKFRETKLIEIERLLRVEYKGIEVETVEKTIVAAMSLAKKVKYYPPTDKIVELAKKKIDEVIESLTGLSSKGFSYGQDDFFKKITFQEICYLRALWGIKTGYYYVSCNDTQQYHVSDIGKIGVQKKELEILKNIFIDTKHKGWWCIKFFRECTSPREVRLTLANAKVEVDRLNAITLTTKQIENTKSAADIYALLGIEATYLKKYVS